MGKKNNYKNSVVGQFERGVCFVLGTFLFVLGAVGLAWLLFGGLFICSPECDLSIWRVLVFASLFTVITLGGIGNIVYAFVPRHPSVPWKSVKWAQEKHRPTVYGVKVLSYYLRRSLGRNN
jgi:uncharacterized BrkB/YihY/UPF0761 family membrane protein